MAAITNPSSPHENNITSQTIATDTDTSGVQFAPSAKTKELNMYTKVSSRTDGTFTPKIEGSQDGGTTWVTLKSGTAISSNTQNFTSWVSQKDGALPPLLRITVTSASTTSGATVEASIKLDYQ
jgi:hypothetical protein